ncbi:MAG: biotin/lipoyl-containing protein [bacterium]
MHKPAWIKFSVILVLFFSMICFFSTYVLAIDIMPGDGEITLSWMPPTKNEDGTPLTDLVGYNIYRAEERDDYKKINKELIKKIIFTDTSVINGKTYYYKVTAVDSSNNESRYSGHISGIARVQPPEGFTIKAQDGYVELFWQPYNKSSLSAFKIYRSETPLKANSNDPVKSREYKTEISTIGPESHYYQDKNVDNGINYYYNITSIDKNGEESFFSPEMGATPRAPIPFTPSGVTARYFLGQVALSWESVEDVIGYNIYRRELTDGQYEGVSFKKCNSEPVTNTEYVDKDVSENQAYAYSIVGINKGGMESSYPLEVECRTSAVYIASFTHNAGTNPLKNGDLLVFKLFGTPGCKAYVRISSRDRDPVNKEILLEEIKDGEYHYAWDINEKQGLTDATVTAYLKDSKDNIISFEAQDKIEIDTIAPPRVENGEAKWEETSKSIKIWWQPPYIENIASGDFSYFDIYRSPNKFSQTIESDQDTIHIARILKEENRFEYNDYDYKKRHDYYYAIEVVDKAGNKSLPFILNKQSIHTSLNDSSGPAISQFYDNTGGLNYKTGDSIKVTMVGEPDCLATFSLSINPDQEISMQEVEPGVYKGEYIIQATDTSLKTLIIGRLKYNDENISVERTKAFFALNAKKDDSIAPKIDSAGFNFHETVGFSGTLVKGDELTIKSQGESGGAASFIITDREIRDIKEFLLHEPKYVMQEVEAGSGIYQGKYIIEKQWDINEGFVYVVLSDLAGNKSLAKTDENIFFDTRSKISVEIDTREFLVKDKGSTGIIVKVTNANGHPIEGHDIAIHMTITDEYTGTVGAGEIKIDGNLETESFNSISDRDGIVEARYEAGASAKTAIIVAKDLMSGSVGVNYIINKIEEHALITLVPIGKARYLAASKYKIIVSADPERITADGVSMSRIVAQLANLNNEPVPVAGCGISFSLNPLDMDDGGELLGSTIRLTDNEGQAVINYQAGIRRGQVAITATLDKVTSSDLNKYLKATGSTHITLMSDAPAKIEVGTEPDTLPADGRSRSAIKVAITDLNDNPVQNALVEYKILRGIGSLTCRTVATNNNGNAECEYIAGTIPDNNFDKDDLSVLIRMGISSKVPSEEELAKARGTVFVPLFYPDFKEDEEVKVIKWFKRENESIEKNEPLVEVKAPDGRSYQIKAPVSGTLTDIRVHKRDSALLGQTIGIIKSTDRDD